MCESCCSQDRNGQAGVREDRTTKMGAEHYEMQVAMLVSVCLTSALDIDGSVLMP